MTQTHSFKGRRVHNGNKVSTCSCGWKSGACEHRFTANAAWIEHYDDMAVENFLRVVTAR